VGCVGYVRRSDGRVVAPYLRENTHFSMVREIKIISGVTRVEFVSDRMSYIILRGSW
jgi:hypothetical protein